MTNVYVLVFAYADKSGFKVCGVTADRIVAEAWYNAADETDVYFAGVNDAPVNYSDGIKGWRQETRERIQQPTKETK